MDSDATASGRRLRDRVYRAPSPIHGFGLFARAFIPAGGYIGTYRGPEARRDGTYVLWVYGADGTYEGRSGRNLLRWLNHGTPGNAVFDGFDLYASRDVAAGDEITIDYGDGS